MFMTDEQKYAAVLKGLGELLEDKDNTISCQKWQIDQLKEKLAAAEQELHDAKEELNIANGQVFDALQKIALLEGGAA